MSAAKLVARKIPYKKSLPPLIGMTDPVRLADPQKLLSHLPKGSVLVWRLFGATPTREAIGVLARMVAEQKCLLLIAGHGRGFQPHFAHGTHLPQGALARSSFRNRARPGLVTAAAHSERALHAAKRAGVDAVLVSPVFATETHGSAIPLGVIRFAALARRARELGLGVYALGGMTPAARKRLRGIPMAGMAGIGVFSASQA